MRVEPRCIDCTRGYYKDAVGNSACSKCPEGKTTLRRGATKATDCSKAFSYFYLCILTICPSFEKYFQICIRIVVVAQALIVQNKANIFTTRE